jgi:hypothetical protein
MDRPEQYGNQIRHLQRLFSPLVLISQKVSFLDPLFEKFSVKTPSCGRSLRVVGGLMDTPFGREG